MASEAYELRRIFEEATEALLKKYGRAGALGINQYVKEHYPEFLARHQEEFRWEGMWSFIDRYFKDLEREHKAQEAWERLRRAGKERDYPQEGEGGEWVKEAVERYETMREMGIGEGDARKVLGIFYGESRRMVKVGMDRRLEEVEKRATGVTREKE